MGSDTLISGGAHDRPRVSSSPSFFQRLQLLLPLRLPPDLSRRDQMISSGTQEAHPGTVFPIVICLRGVETMGLPPRVPKKVYPR